VTRRRLLGTTVAATVAGLLLSACTGDPAERPDAPTGTSSAPASRPTQSPTTEQVDAAPPPEGACYRLSFAEATAPTTDEQPVRCRRRHTAQTYHVGRLDLLVDGHLLAVDSRTAQRQAQRGCGRALADHLGGTERERRLLRVAPVWFTPSFEQADAGASWYRCDAVVLAAGDRLGALPGPARLAGIADSPGALEQVGLCGTAAPGSRRFRRVVCSRPHRWQAVTTIDIPGGRRYPGRAAVRQAGDEACRDHVRELTGSPDRFSYGWEWPTREQWRSGQRHGFCWAPD
jgi:hypothetical protein